MYMGYPVPSGTSPAHPHAPIPLRPVDLPPPAAGTLSLPVPLLQSCLLPLSPLSLLLPPYSSTPHSSSYPSFP